MLCAHGRALEAAPDAGNVSSSADQKSEDSANDNDIDDALPTKSIRARSDEDFPRFEEYDTSRVDERQLPLERSTKWEKFPWFKFCLVLLGYVLWLRVMRLIAEDQEHFQTAFWSTLVFISGLCGILLAILLPAYVWGATVLVLTCLIPFWQYQRWRNTQVDSTVPQLRWKHLLMNPNKRFRSPDRAEVKLGPDHSGESAPQKIVLSDTNLASTNGTGGTLETGQISSGFEAAITLVNQAVTQKATDLHLSKKDDCVAVRLRVDGELVPLEPLSSELGKSVINVFKVLCDLNIADRRRSQDGSFRCVAEGRRINLRVSAMGTNTGEKLSIRILDPAHKFAKLSELGMTDELREQIVAELGRNDGLILFVGRTGAGKTTTAYSAIRSFDPGDRNIMTIEDPIEYSIPSVDQIEVNSRAGQTFQTGLRNLLRQDVDVVLIGEIRDMETAQTACQAAATGQLVLSTLHAADSVSAIYRMLDLGCDRHNLGIAVRLIVTQQLIRRLCSECRTAYRPDDDLLQRLSLENFEGKLFRPPEPEDNGCLHCNGKGFLGRAAVFEELKVTPTIRNLMYDNAGATQINAQARSNGMMTLWDDGIRLVCDGTISVEHFLQSLDDR